MKGYIALTSNWANPIQPGPPIPRKCGARKAYKLKVPRKRKIPREARQQIYQLELTRMETEREIRRIMDGFGFSKQGRNKQRQRIIEERGE